MSALLKQQLLVGVGSAGASKVRVFTAAHIGADLSS